MWCFNLPLIATQHTLGTFFLAAEPLERERKGSHTPRVQTSATCLNAFFLGGKRSITFKAESFRKVYGAAVTLATFGT